MIDFSVFAPRIRAELGKDLTYAEVSQILDVFIGIIIGDLSDNGKVTVPGLGEFRARYMSGRRLYVKFAPHPITKRALSASLGGRYQMEKYGVEQEQSTDKTAAKVGTCPSCGQQLEASSAVPKCPKCGTKPFEQKKEPADDSKGQEGSAKEEASQEGGGQS